MAKTENHCYKWHEKYLQNSLNPLSTKNTFKVYFYSLCAQTKEKLRMHLWKKIKMFIKCINSYWRSCLRWKNTDCWCWRNQQGQCQEWRPCGRYNSKTSALNRNVNEEIRMPLLRYVKSKYLYSCWRAWQKLSLSTFGKSLSVHAIRTRKKTTENKDHKIGLCKDHFSKKSEN